MAAWPASAGFAERHLATMDLMKALKAYLNLPQEELSRTASEIEKSCLEKSASKEHYFSLIHEQKDAISNKPVEIAANPDEVSITTGVSHQADAETQVIGRYVAVYHERSLNADIYKARDPASTSPEAWFALKVVALDSQMAPHDIKHEAEFLRRLSPSSSSSTSSQSPINTTVIASSSSSSSSAANIIPLLGAEPLAGGLFALKLPFRRFDLGSLAAQGVLSAASKRRHLADVFRALRAVHAAGIVHRDIKPSNVLLERTDGSGPAQLIDFGIAWAADVNGGGEGGGGGGSGAEPAAAKITDVGTGAYRPPELLFGCRDYGPELDMWAAGCTAAEVLAGGGRTLFDAGIVTRDDFLGSDLTLVNSIFRKLGTPTDATWPEAKTFRDWGKIQFKDFPATTWQEMLPNVEPVARDLVAGLVLYSGRQRMSADQTLNHEYFRSQ